MSYKELWLLRAKGSARFCEYDAEILELVMKIIEEKDYPELFSILSNYDGLVKAIGKNIDNIYKVDRSHPYWAYPPREKKGEEV